MVLPQANSSAHSSVLQDACLRQLPVASCLDIWGVVEKPAGTPSKSSWFARGKDKTKPLDATASKLGRSRYVRLQMIILSA